MKIKAKISFVWHGLSMTAGEVADVKKELAEGAVKNGLAELSLVESPPHEAQPAGGAAK